MTLRRLFPDMPEAEHISSLADASFTHNKIAVELAYLSRPLSAGFERPYGWAWLLYLHLEASRHDRPWAAELEPLARPFADRLRHYLDILTYPIRVGTHFNTAFALILSLEWAGEHDAPLANLIRAVPGNVRRRSRLPGLGTLRRRIPVACAVEALCMARVLPSADFERWFRGVPAATRGTRARDLVHRPSSSIAATARSPTSTA